ncbi:MAG: ribonuclease HII [Treponema sp.]|jgi:ribonuclease HII|nr:ribonuclease HII [Treponema sp.]
MICGIDEAGRGPLAGPVYAAAVVLPRDFPSDCLNDSKKLSRSQRTKAEVFIREKAFFGIGFADHEEIDVLNILRASLLAMQRAFTVLKQTYPTLHIDETIVDGLYIPDIEFPCRAVVKADASVPAVMAASILAKQERDRVMTEYARLYPNYGYEKHKGYPTRLHVQRIAEFGPSPIQRLTFRVKRNQTG